MVERCEIGAEQVGPLLCVEKEVHSIGRVKIMDYSMYI